jgi:signal transduction histidine kinase
MSIKSRQVAGVTSLVLFIVASLSAYHLATLARMSLEESQARGELLRQMIFQRAREVVPNAKDPYQALQDDGSLRSLLESAGGFSGDVVYATIVNRERIAIAHNFKTEEGQPIPDQEELTKILERNAISLLQTVYSDRTFEVRQPLLFGEQEFGTIKIGISTILVRNELQLALQRAAQSALLALLISTAVATLMAQWILRPIHVIQSGLTRLGRGELDVQLELPEGEEFKDLGSSFAAVSAQLTESRTKANSPSDFESIVDNLEDAVALFSPDGRLIFCNPAMSVVLPEFADGNQRLDDILLPNNEIRAIVDRTLASHQAQGPVSVEHMGSERLLMTHPVDDGQGKFVGAMLVARNLAYMTQMHSTLNYSRKLAALGRLMAGVAHEVKNPLNAMMIHLELLRTKIRGTLAAALQPEPVSASGGMLGLGPGRANPLPAPVQGALEHVSIIESEIRRLDEVVQGFLKFTRPEDLRLQPVKIGALFDEILPVIETEANKHTVRVTVEAPASVPAVNGDAAMLRQVFLNLAINACQAMKSGGALRITATPASRGRVEIRVEDTGVGIAPEHLSRIFDLYFTTKERGTGIGLSMVYRIIQMHDGEIEVQSTPGRGTTFRVLVPRAQGY